LRALVFSASGGGIFSATLCNHSKQAANKFYSANYITAVGDALKQTEPRRMHFCSSGYIEATFLISKNIEFKHLNFFLKNTMV
jgi:hypothetical protein